MNEYTPGPWTAHWGQIQDKHGIRIYALESKEFRLRPLAEVSFVGDDFSHANGNLIAAAPDLYESAQRTLGWLKTFLGSKHFDELNSPEIDMLKEALAKAKGAK